MSAAKQNRKAILAGGAAYLRYASIGIEMGVAIVIGLLIGLWLDRHFGTKPWLTMVFLLLGIAAGFRNVFRLLAEINAENERPDR